MIVLSTELAKGTVAQAEAKTRNIYTTALNVFAHAEANGINTLEAAIALAKENIAKHRG